MSGDILDLIDGAIDAWETSPDAMRWSPDPTAVPARPASTPLLDAVTDFLARACAEMQPPVELTSWQREVLARTTSSSALVAPLRFDRLRHPIPPPSAEFAAWHAHALMRADVGRLFGVPPNLLT